MCPVCWLDAAWILASGLAAGAGWLLRAGLAKMF